MGHFCVYGPNCGVPKKLWGTENTPQQDPMQMTSESQRKHLDNSAHNSLICNFSIFPKRKTTPNKNFMRISAKVWGAKKYPSIATISYPNVWVFCHRPYL